jgi:hypothetical protein
MMRPGDLVRIVGRGMDLCMIVSIDDPTVCCGYDTCNCGRGHTAVYVPECRVVWQTGRLAGSLQSIVAALVLQASGKRYT